MTEARDEFQEYLEALRTWAQRANERRGEWIIISELLEEEMKSGGNEARALIQWREAQMTEQDQRDAAGLLETGIFAEEPETFRAAAIVTCMEIERHLRNLELCRTVERYRPEQDAAFSEAPELKDEITKRKEMVSLRNLHQDDRSSAFIFDSGAGSEGSVEVKLTSQINPELINFVKTHAPAESLLEVRLDPDYPGPSADPPFATYMPELHNDFLNLLGGVPFGRLLQAKLWTVAPAEGTFSDARLLAEYFSGGYRAVEMAGVSDAGRFEVYFEEIVDRSKVYIDHRDDDLKVQSDGPVIGRMIHCDTSASADTPCDEVILYHLDLAINVYEGTRAAERLATPLPKRVEATRRIHLFKATPLPLKLLPGIAVSFFGCHRILRQALKELRQGGLS